MLIIIVSRRWGSLQPGRVLKVSVCGMVQEDECRVCIHQRCSTAAFRTSTEWTVNQPGKSAGLHVILKKLRDQHVIHS